MENSDNERDEMIDLVLRDMDPEDNPLNMGFHFGEIDQESSSDEDEPEENIEVANPEAVNQVSTL